MGRSKPLFEQVRSYTGMYLPETTFNAAVSFLTGYDYACEEGLLLGFREWLILRLGSKYWNLSWPPLVLHVAFPDASIPEHELKTPEAHRRAIDALFTLLDEFDVGVRRKRDGLMKLFAEFARAEPTPP